MTGAAPVLALAAGNSRISAALFSPEGRVGLRKNDPADFTFGGLPGIFSSLLRINSRHLCRTTAGSSLLSLSRQE